MSRENLVGTAEPSLAVEDARRRFLGYDLNIGRIRATAEDIHEDCGCDRPGCWASCIKSEAGEVLALLRIIDALVSHAAGQELRSDEVRLPVQPAAATAAAPKKDSP